MPDKSNGPYYRLFSLDIRAIDEKNRSVDVSFSSEEPDKPHPWSDPQVLLHGAENVDLTRLKTTGSVLLNHQPVRAGEPVVIVGKPENIRIEGKRGLATIVFDEDDQSDTAFKKVVSGSLRGSSVRAQIHNVRQVLDGEEFEGFEGPMVLATKWEPVEISLTPIPVDASVGVSRSLSDIQNIEISKSIQEDKTMPLEKKDIQQMIDDVVKGLKIPSAADIATEVRSMMAEDAKPKMQISTETLQDLAGRAGGISLELKSKVTDMAIEGKSETDILRAINDAMIEDPDANDKGELDDDKRLKSKKIGPTSAITTFEGLKDEDFLRGLGQPGVVLH